MGYNKFNFPACFLCQESFVRNYFGHCHRNLLTDSSFDWYGGSAGFVCDFDENGGFSNASWARFDLRCRIWKDFGCAWKHSASRGCATVSSRLVFDRVGWYSHHRPSPTRLEARDFLFCRNASMEAIPRVRDPRLLHDRQRVTDIFDSPSYSLNGNDRL